MASITLSMNKEQRGPCMLLDFTLNCVQTHRNEIKSKALKIDGLGIIQFYFKYDIDDKTVTAYYATKIYNYSTGAGVRMNVVSAPLNYSGESVCSNDWSQYVHIGKLSCISSCNNTILYQLKLNVTAKMGSKLHVYEKFYKDTNLVDFRLSTADGSAYVSFHKLILSAYSEVFKSLFENDWKQSVQGRIDVKEATVSTLKYLKDYLYMSVLSETGFQELLIIIKLAQRYVMNELKKECVKKIVDTMTSYNLYTAVKLACEHNVPELAFAIVVETPNSVVHAAYEDRKNR